MRQNVIGLVGLIGVGLGVGLAAGSSGQSLEPVAKYVGLDRAVRVNVEAESEDLSIVLLTSQDEVVAEGGASAGEVDLAAIFPMLWDRWDDDAALGSPITGGEADLLYAQLVVDGERQGSALVLQPLLTPQAATPAGNGVQWSPRVHGRVTYSGLRVYPERHVLVETTEGTMEFQLRPDHAPNTVHSFLELAGNGYYDGVIFNRIINQGQTGRFVIQGGDPTGTGTGGPGFFIDLEDSKLPHDFGVISMARSSDPNSNGSQFFVCLSRDGTSFLDGRYTAFGEAVGGADAINAVASSPTGPGDRPVNPPMIESTRLIPAPPRGSAPTPVTDPSAPAVEPAEE